MSAPCPTHISAQPRTALKHVSTKHIRVCEPENGTWQPPSPQPRRTPWAQVAFWIPTQVGGYPRQCGCLLVIAEGSRVRGQKAPPQANRANLQGLVPTPPPPGTDTSSSATEQETRAVLENPILLLLRTALKDHQPPTANRQPPTASNRRKTANHCSILFLWFWVLPMSCP